MKETTRQIRHCPKCNAQEIIVKSYRRKIMLAVFLILLIALLSISAGLCVKQGDWPLVFLDCSLIVVNLIHFSKLIYN